MTQTQFAPDLWLESLTRALGAFCEASLDDPDVKVEMSFPNTSVWTKDTPLSQAIVHFEQDDIQTPTLGFGIPGDDVIDDTVDPPTVLHREAVLHLVNFDVGVWVSAEMGGVTKRMELVRKLKTMFSTATGKVAFNEATGGLWPVSFEGGSNQLDRVNDIPLWRALGMTLVVKAFERVTPLVPDVQLDGTFTQDPELVIIDNGVLSPVDTP